MRRALTLIELLISVALGLTICLGVFAALRVATQASATVTRLSIENRLMGAGMLAALDELDTWRAYDDPDDASRQPLRAPGQPFQAIDFNAPECSLDLDQSDPRTWYRGAGVVSNVLRFDPATAPGDHPYGDYSLHAKLGHADPQRQWYGGFIRHLIDQLGYYAMFDYAPAGTLFSYHGADGIIPPELSRLSHTQIGELYQDHSWWGRDEPRQMLSLTYLLAAGVSTDQAWVSDGLARRVFSGYVGGPWALDQVVKLAVQPMSMPLTPRAWPALRVEVNRFVSTARFWSYADVLVASPVTGERMNLHLSTHSTTLRGARMSRRPGLGWAAPGDPNLDAP